MQQEQKKKIIYKNTQEITPYPNNPRIHSTAQIDQIVKSIEEFGFTAPLLIDENNMLLAGHGRLLAAQEMKLEAIPCVVIAGLSEAQKKAYVIADNNIALNADWDENLLAEELRFLHENEYNTDLTFLESARINELLNLEITDSDFPDLPEGHKDPFTQMTFSIHETQYEIIKEALDLAIQATKDIDGNRNSNALFLICEAYLNDKC